MKKNWLIYILICVLLPLMTCSYEDDPTVATPTADPEGGFHFPAVGGIVKLACDTPGATIYYTTKDTEPDETYGGQIIVRESVTIKAVAKRKFWNDSEILIVSYTVEEKKEEEEEEEEEEDDEEDEGE